MPGKELPLLVRNAVLPSFPTITLVSNLSSVWQALSVVLVTDETF